MAIESGWAADRAAAARVSKKPDLPEAALRLRHRLAPGRSGGKRTGSARDPVKSLADYGIDKNLAAREQCGSGGDPH